MRSRNLDELDSKLTELKAKQLKVKKAMASEIKRREEASIKSLGLIAFNAGLYTWEPDVLRVVMEALAAHGPSPELAESIRALPSPEASKAMHE